MQRKKDQAPTEAPKEQLEVAGTSENNEVVTSVSKTIRSLGQALKAAKVNMRFWEVERYTVNKWDSARGTKADTWDAIELWQVKVWLRRKVNKDLEETAAFILKRMRKHAPKYELIQYHQPTSDATPHLLELSLTDIHMGKLCWKSETGHNYDLKTTRAMVIQAARILLDRVKTYYIEKIVIVVGNDYFQVNNAEMTTAKGTPQDTDGRLPKIFEYGHDTMITVIDMCRKIAPVEILWVPGNHDPETSWYLAKYLEAWYHNDKSVTVDVSPNSRKCLLYGPTLIGWTHGNEEEQRDLAAIMAGEWPQLWANSRFRRWHLGHLHKKKEMFTKVADTYGAGVETKILPSLTGLDAWHAKRGYMSNRAAEAHLFSLLTGPTAFFTVSASELNGE